MEIPFCKLLGMQLESAAEGTSQCTLTVREAHFNPHHCVHGGVLYALADTGMGAALYSRLAPDEYCATIEIKMSYFKVVHDGVLRCTSRVIKHGKRIACLESELFNQDVLVAKASGSFSILKRDL